MNYFPYSDSYSDALLIRPVDAAEFRDDLSDFLYERFRGAVDADFSGDFFGTLMIAPRGFAFFLRELLKFLLGQHILTLNAVSDGKTFKAIFSFSCEKELPMRLRYDLLHVAESSGFTMHTERQNGRMLITLTAKQKDGASFSVYARSAHSVRRDLYDVVFAETAVSL